MRRVHITSGGAWKFNRLWWDGRSERMEFESRCGFVLVADCKRYGWQIVDGWYGELQEAT